MRTKPEAKKEHGEEGLGSSGGRDSCVHGSTQRTVLGETAFIH